MYPSRNRPSTRWLIIPLVVIASIIAVVVGAGLYLTAAGYRPAGFYLFPFPFFPLIFIPIVFLVFFGFRWFIWGCWWWGRSGYYDQYYDPAMVALRERYAKGEITKEQLDQMTKDLEQN